VTARLAVAVVALAACAPVDSFFSCNDDAQCVLGGRSGGRCEAAGFCSFPDGSCPSGRRYHDARGGDVCVGAGCGVRLDDLHPRAAAVGDPVWLEGVFPAGASVVFSSDGGDLAVPTTQPATGRLSIAVPTGATRGTVGVTASGCTSTRLPFEVVAAGSAPQDPFTAVAETLPSDGQALVDLGARVVSFGNIAGARNRTIDAAARASDGALQSFAAAGALSVVRALPCAVSVGDRIHVIGGHDGTRALASIESIAVADFPGVLDQPAVTLRQPRFGHQCVVLGNFVYALGGGGTVGSLDALATVERAPVDSDGTLGAFSDAGVALIKPRLGFGLVVAGRYLYVFGGFNGNDLDFDSERAIIDSDGTLEAFADWQRFAVDNNGVREVFTTLVVGRDVYLLGGFSSGVDLTTVAHAQLGLSDDLGSFADGPLQLTTARENASALISGGRLWLVGGDNGHDAAVPSLEWAALR
jgi:hypothetical protein